MDNNNSHPRGQPIPTAPIRSNRDNLSFIFEPSRYARRGVPMCTPVVASLRVPPRHDFANFATTTRLTAAIRNLTTFQTEEIDPTDVQVAVVPVANEEENPTELFFYILHIVAPDAIPGRYSLEFTAWRTGADGEEHIIGAASSRMFEVIIKNDAPLDALTGEERRIIRMLQLETVFDLHHLGLDDSYESDR